MNIDKAIKIKEHNRHRGILCPTPEEFEADDLSIEALKAIDGFRKKQLTRPFHRLPGETKEK